MAFGLECYFPIHRHRNIVKVGAGLRFLNLKFEQGLDHRAAGPPLGLCLEVREDSMSQDRLGNCLKVLESNHVAAFENSTRLGALD
jgi:hypothetical protein